VVYLVLPIIENNHKPTLREEDEVALPVGIDIVGHLQYEYKYVFFLIKVFIKMLLFKFY